MDKEKFLSSGLLDQFVLGLTSEKEAKIVHRYAEVFPDIKAAIISLKSALEQYARANSVEPPSGLRQKHP